MNPASETDLELGTRANPYKSINFPLLELYNFGSYNNLSAIVKVAKGAVHYLEHHLTAINNMNSVVFEPYDSMSKVDSSNEYSSIDRVHVIIQDAGASLFKKTTQFNVLSYFEMNSTIIELEEDLARDLVLIDLYVSLPIIKTSVTFKNIRIEDQIQNEVASKIVTFRAFKLEKKLMNFEKVDIKVMGTILEAFFPMSFYASQINIIDYHNLGKGFVIDVN